MKIKAWEIVSVLAAVGAAAALYWAANLANRVGQLEKSGQEQQTGPRGRSCQLIVARLVERPTDEGLKALADEWGCSRAPEVQANRPAAPAPPGDQISRARAAVLAALKDPDSARFGEFRRGRPGFLCGTVNARNPLGGYTGPRAFFWSVDGVRIYQDPPDWTDKAVEAEIFAQRGCSIGPDHGRALNVKRLLDESNERMSNKAG